MTLGIDAMIAMWDDFGDCICICGGDLGAKVMRKLLIDVRSIMMSLNQPKL